MQEPMEKPETINTQESTTETETKTPSLNSRIIPANLTDDEKIELIRMIESEMTLIDQEYQETGYYDKIESCNRNYNPQASVVTDSDARPNIKLAFQKLVVAILVARALRQTFQVDPLILMENDGELKLENLRIRQDALDYELRNKVKLEELDNAVYEHAIYEPVAVVKVPYSHEVEYYTKVEIYEPTPADIGRYTKDFASLLNNPESEERRNLDKLLAGEKIIIAVDDKKVIRDGAAPYRVDPMKFFARAKIKDFRKHRVISEQLDFSWPDIEARVTPDDDGKTLWDVQAVEKLKERYKDRYWKENYIFFESIVLWDRKKNGQSKRYVVTFESTTKEIVRAVHYPHADICYVPYSVFPRDNSWIGESLLDMINDIVDVFCAFLNSMIYEEDLSKTPIIITSDSQSVTRRPITLNAINVIPLAKDSTFQQIRLGTPSSDRIGVMNLLIEFLSIMAGIDPRAISGMSPSGDPRASGVKIGIKMQQTQQRIEDMIYNLQKGDALLAEQVEKIKYEFSDDNLYWKNGQKNVVEKSSYRVPVRYVVHGSRTSFNKVVDGKIIDEFILFLAKLFPGIFNDINVKEALLTAKINNSGGSISKIKDVILSPIQSYIEIRKKYDEYVSQTRAQGQQPLPFEMFAKVLQGEGGDMIPQEQQENTSQNIPASGKGNVPYSGDNGRGLPGAGAPDSTPQQNSGNPGGTQ